MLAETNQPSRDEYFARRARLGMTVRPKLNILPRSQIPGVAYEFVQRKNKRHEFLNLVDYTGKKIVDADILIPAERWKIICDEVCQKHSVTLPMIRSKRRNRFIVKARQEIAYRLSQETTMSMPQIASKMGYEDHTTPLHCIKKYKKDNGL